MDTSKIKEISKGVKEIKNAGKIVWGGYIDKTGAPGPTKLIGGNSDAGFFGEVSTSGFVTGDELARLIGLYAGESQFSNEPWLKFVYMGKIEFIAKKPFRYNICWNDINAVNAVFGNRTVNIVGRIYKIRLMKGQTEGKQDEFGSYGDVNKGSEWNKLMLPIHKDAPSNWKHPENVDLPTENWSIGYTNSDLIIDITGSLGGWTVCQEHGNSDLYRLLRGIDDISGAGANTPDFRYEYFGWRPVLELVR